MLVVDLPSASGPASVAAGIASAGGTAEGFDCDVSQGADIKAMIGRAVELWGRLDIVVNNAMWMGKGGPAGGIQGNAVELEEESWDYAFAVGIKSQYLATKHAVPEMVKVGGEHDRLRTTFLCGLRFHTDAPAVFQAGRS